MAREDGENENQVPAVIFFLLSVASTMAFFCSINFTASWAWMEFVCQKSYLC